MAGVAGLPLILLRIDSFIGLFDGSPRMTMLPVALPAVGRRVMVAARESTWLSPGCG